MKRYSYSFKIKTVPQINEIDIWCEIYKLQNITLDLDNILNNFLKIMNLSFIKAITAFI